MEGDDGNRQYTPSEDAFVAADGKGGQRRILHLCQGRQTDRKAGTAAEKPKKRRIGFMEGESVVPDDFDTMMADEIEEMFYGGSLFPR